MQNKPKSISPIHEEKEKRNILFCAICVLLCARHVLQILGFSTIASFLFKLLYVAVFVFLCDILVRAIIRSKETKEARRFLLFFSLVFACLIYLCIRLFLHFPSHLEASVTFLLALPLLACFDMVKLSKKDARLFFYLMLVIAVILAVAVFIKSSYRDGLLLLYAPNPNTSGLLYMSVFLALYSFLFLNKKHILGWLVLAALLYGCWQTESRAAFIACIACILLSFLSHKNIKIGKIFVIAALVVFVLLPLLAPALLTKILGEGILTGREIIWPHLLGQVLDDPFTMKIDRIAYADVLGNDLGAHNVWLDIAWKYSLPIAIVFLFVFLFSCKSIYRKTSSHRYAIIAAVFVSGLIHMSFEASLIAGALDYTLYFLLTLFSAHTLIEYQEKEEAIPVKLEPIPEEEKE